MYAVSVLFELLFNFLKLSVKLNLHTARLPTPDIESENAVDCEATIYQGVVYMVRRKYFTLNTPRVSALSKYSLISVKNCKGPFTPNESERESEKDQRTIGRDQTKNSNIKENFRFRMRFHSLDVNGP